MSENQISAERVKLLAELELIVGSECYNGNIQNYGANGVRYREGRSFRYPLTIYTESGEKEKSRGSSANRPPEEIMTGYYAFGANQLQIIQALDAVLKHLEKTFDVDFSK